MNMEKQAKKFMKGAKSNWNKAKRTYICRSLKDLIKAYRACTTRTEERALVKKEAAHIRDLFREGDKHFRRQNIAKLLFFHMNGYPTDFGIRECINLCASPKFADKRVAYLGMTILADETDSVLMLMTNSLKQDLNNPDVHIVSLALNVLGDIASAEMVRELMPEIETHMRSPNPHIRKKAGLAAVRAVRKLSAEDTVNILNFVPNFFDTRSSAVHVSGTALISALCEQDEANAAALQISALPIIMSILGEHASGRPPQRNADLYGSTHDAGNPFLVTKLLTALRILISPAPVEDSVTANAVNIITTIASRFDVNKTSGCAILYECVRTAFVLGSSPATRALITDTLGRFVDHKEATVRYIALQELTSLADSEGAHALSAIPNLREKLKVRLHERDPTVRRQAVELVFRVTDSHTVETTVNEIAEYVRSSAPDDGEAIRDACEKMFLLADEHAPSDEWRVDTFITALVLGHRYISDALMSCLVALVSARAHIRVHAVRLLFAQVLRPFATRVRVTDLLDGSSSNTGFTSDGGTTRPERRPRCESVALQIVAEHVAVVKEAGLKMEEVVAAFEYFATAGDDGEDGVELAVKDVDDGSRSAFNAVGEAAVSGLVKIAVRGSGGTAMSGDVDGSGGGGSDLADLMAGLDGGAGVVPALPAPTTTVEDELALAVIPAQETDKQVALFDADLAMLGVLDEPAGGNASFSQRSTAAGGAGNVPLKGDLVQRVRSILSKVSTAQDVELQQRACEYVAMLDNGVAAAAAKPAPAMKYTGVRAAVSQTSGRRGHEGGVNVASGGDGLLLDLLDEEGDGSSAVPAITMGESSGAGSLAAVADDDPLAALGALALGENSSTAAGTTGAGPSVMGGVDDMLALTMGEEGLAPSGDHISASPKIGPVAMTTMSGLEPTVSSGSGDTPSTTVEPKEVTTLFLEKEDVRMEGTFSRVDAGDGSRAVGRIVIANTSGRSISDCVLQLAVPKYMKLDMDPASSGSAAAGESISQLVHLTNSAHGLKPMQLRFRVEFLLEGDAAPSRYEGVAGNIDSE